MGLYIPSVEQLPLETDAQKANAERMLGLIGSIDTEILLPHWMHRIEAWNSFLATYDTSPRDMGTATRSVVNAVCRIEKIEDSQKQREVLRHVEDSDFGRMIDKVTTELFALHDVDFFLRSVTEKNAFDRHVYKIGTQAITNELTMLGTEFKVAEIGQAFQETAENNVLYGDMLFYVGLDNDETHTQMNVDDTYDELLSLSDKYSALKRRKMKPIEPERLIGVVHHALQNSGIIDSRY